MCSFCSPIAQLRVTFHRVSTPRKRYTANLSNSASLPRSWTARTYPAASSAYLQDSNRAEMARLEVALPSSLTSLPFRLGPNEPADFFGVSRFAVQVAIDFERIEPRPVPRRSSKAYVDWASGEKPPCTLLRHRQRAFGCLPRSLFSPEGSRADILRL